MIINFIRNVDTSAVCLFVDQAIVLDETLTTVRWHLHLAT